MLYVCFIFQVCWNKLFLFLVFMIDNMRSVEMYLTFGLKTEFLTWKFKILIPLILISVSEHTVNTTVTLLFASHSLWFLGHIHWSTTHQCWWNPGSQGCHLQSPACSAMLLGCVISASLLAALALILQTLCKSKFSLTSTFPTWHISLWMLIWWSCLTKVYISHWPCHMAYVLRT